MDEITFACTKTELLKKLKRIRSFVQPKSEKARKATTLEIRIQPSFVSFNIPGGSEKIDCTTKGWASFTLSLEYFYQILMDHNSVEFSPVFSNGEMRVGGLITTGIGFKIQGTHPENKATLDLPLNYSDIDILKLRRKTKDAHLEIVNAKTIIDAAELILTTKIEEAFTALKFYGVSRDELKQLVEQHIGQIPLHNIPEN